MNIEDFEELLNKRIIDAYSQGYSVIEITRALRKNSVDSVYKLLRNTGYIPIMDRSEYRRQYDIDKRLSAALKKKGFSFGRWCLSWRLKPTDTVIELKSPQEEGTECVAYSAMKRDFPEVFISIFGGKKIRKEARRRLRTHPDSLRIDWNLELKSFIATVPECPDIEASGKDWDDALYALKSVYRMHEYILRLDRLVDNSRKISMAH